MPVVGQESLRRLPVLVAGLALPLAFAPFDLYLLAPLCLALLFLSWQHGSPQRAARDGFLFGCAAFLGGLYWLYISLHTFGNAPLVLALPLMAAVIMIMAAYLALLGYLLARCLPRSGLFAWLLVWPAAWTLIEWLRGWLFTGFPWLALGYSQSDSPLGGLAPLLGVYGVSAAVAITAGALLALLRGHQRQRVVAALVLPLLWGAAAGLGGLRWTEPVGEPLSVSLVQGAVAQDRKWLPEQLEPTKRLYRELTERHWGRDLIVWPEAAIPAQVHEIEDYLVELRREAVLRGSDLLMGVIKFDFLARQHFNAVLLLGQEVGFYHKRHLVPFGEYFPVPEFVRRWLRLMSLPYSDFAAGAERQSPLRAAGQHIAVSICYEDVFGAEQIGWLERATLLVNVSNDAWFGGSVAPHQHLQIARFRALEADRYMLRATNTGISAIISPRGAIEQSAPQFETHVLNGTVQPRQGLTPYARFGNHPVVFGALLLVLAGWLQRRRAGSGDSP